ncbi:hypothetical protein T03_8650 [Trichinella britovi]|uniref:Uncharacterized protein n=3 Tax=Trichinella TaxID=6333 RepID=A0A0V1D768_TRIBR|nr:hypothetical protein T03_8650 [Trichinella britovi]
MDTIYKIANWPIDSIGFSLCTTCKIACQTVLSYKQLWYNGECGALRVVGRPSTDNCYPLLG